MRHGHDYEQQTGMATGGICGLFYSTSRENSLKSTNSCQDSLFPGLRLDEPEYKSQMSLLY